MSHVYSGPLLQSNLYYTYVAAASIEKLIPTELVKSVQHQSEKLFARTTTRRVRCPSSGFETSSRSGTENFCKAVV